MNLNRVFYPITITIVNYIVLHLIMKSTSRMPILFVGHGNPMNAIEDNEFSRKWLEIGKNLPIPKAILCISAHWEIEGTEVTGMDMPKTIHDFGGFPQELYDMQYPAPGAPEIANEISKLLSEYKVKLDFDWGLDHGTWSVLSRMFPKANIPVIQLSLDYTKTPQEHFDLAKLLFPLREKEILIIGSGNIVHNLGILDWDNSSYPWAIEFDATIKNAISKKDYQSLIDYKIIKNAELAIPTNEHFLPLLYILALAGPKEEFTFFNEEITLGSLSMTSIITVSSN